ncbi:uncharacterized protein [Montipora foliosa]|uniref:uncharacterized protein n=1 Tax=Montipora foliosa TaxID=591990 RepID=UPI0035F125D9
MLAEMKSVFGTLVVVFFTLVSVEAVKKCMKIDSCRCSTDTGEINLWSLAGQAPNHPRFNISSPSTETYYLWSPCTNWATQGHPCEDAAVCEVGRKTRPSSFANIGELDLSDCVLDEKNGQCLLTYAVTGSKIKTKIALECDAAEDGKVDPMITDFQGSLTYSTSLHSICACPGKCSLSANKDTGVQYDVISDDEDLSIGAIVGIVIAGVVFTILLAFAILICCLRRKLPSGLPKPSICTTVKVGLSLVKKKLCPCC